MTTSPTPELSIVVPTYREAANLRPLVLGIAQALSYSSMRYEVIIADDDSQDGTREIAEELAGDHPLRLMVRMGKRDLSLAVLDGLKAARGEYLLVMDADLSHPPAQIPEMLAPLKQDRADFVIGSRYVAGGSTHNWGGGRRINSLVATSLARPLSRGLRDSMSGFFALRRSTLETARGLDPIGYKIGLELLCRCDIRRPLEIPIRFQDRTKGDSKLNLEQQARYLIHLNRLYRVKARGRGLLIRPVLAAMLMFVRAGQLLRKLRT